MMLKGLVVSGFAWLPNVESGFGPIKPTNGSVAGTRIYIMRYVMLYHWNPTKKEIENYLDRKSYEFIVQKKRFRD